VTETLGKKGLLLADMNQHSWHSDPVGAYILDNNKSHFRKTKHYDLCRDDGTEAFNNKLTYNDKLK